MFQNYQGIFWGVTDLVLGSNVRNLSKQQCQDPVIFGLCSKSIQHRPSYKRLLLVAIDYFRKWVEAETFTSIKDKDAIQFLWKNIVYRFGIPQSIVIDNGTQFDSRVYKNFCNELKDLVLRRVFENTANTTEGKFQPNWEGPYTVV